MQTRYTNQDSIPLSVAVFLASDNYDHDDTAISATALLKPIRQIVLSKRVPPDQSMVDISGLVASRMGQAIHDAIERAWLHNKDTALQALGYPKRVVERIRVNPKPEEVTEDIIPIYMEQRAYRDLMGVRISGKYDFLAEGRLEDFKSTSTYTWINGNKDEDYQLQGSIYRWLNPNLVTEDHLRINYIFTDWKPGMVNTNPKYPPKRIMPVMIPLLSEAETETFIKNKLIAIDRYKDADEQNIPYCTDKELWRDEPSYKYYKNPAKMTRSTKNFDSLQEANLRLVEDGSVGVVVTVPGQVKACRYCPAFTACTQKDELIADGSLKFQ